MADNIAITAGAGTSIGTKDLAGVHFQKIIWVNEAGGFIAKAEDTAHATGDYLLPIAAVRQDTAVALAGTDADYIPLIVDASGRLHVAIGNVPTFTIAGTPTVAVTSHVTQNVTLLTSAARTATTTAPFTSEYWKGGFLFVDVTAGAATPSVTPEFEIQDPITSTWHNLWVAAAPITSTSAATYKYLVYPGISATEPATITENFEFPLLRTLRLSMVHADADSLTYSGAFVGLP